MSNIIDGIDYGMGYEKATEPGPDVETLTTGETCSHQWVKRQYPKNPLQHGSLYRRPLPIISQHPGAIPLEPGEELKVGERYLLAGGLITSALVNTSGYELTYPLHCPRLMMTWTKAGIRDLEGDYPETNVVARLPKVEKKEPEPNLQELKKQADTEIRKILGDPMPEPEKAKEEKVESEWVTADHPKYGKISQRIDIAAVFAQLPEVIAEVERQRKEKEIGKGDWFRNEGGGVDKCRYNDDGIVVGDSTGHESDAEDCTKIHDPAFIALLEKGSQP